PETPCNTSPSSASPSTSYAPTTRLPTTDYRLPTADPVTCPVTPAAYTRRNRSHGTPSQPQLLEEEWVMFPGGELEGKRPKAVCAACRERFQQSAPGRGEIRGRRTLCFQCYRAELDRERGLAAAG